MLLLLDPLLGELLLAEAYRRRQAEALRPLLLQQAVAEDSASAGAAQVTVAEAVVASGFKGQFND